MRLSIMNSNGRYPRLGTVATLAFAVAAIAGCSAQTTTASQEVTGTDDQHISVALTSFTATSCAGGVTVSGTTTCPPLFFKSSTSNVTINMKDETADIYMSAVDSSLWVNGVQVMDTSVTPNVVAIVAGTKANVKSLNVVATNAGTGDTVILDYGNGLFGLGSTSAAGTTVNLTSAKANTLIIKGTAGNDSFAFGASGANTTMSPATPSISLTNSAKAPTKDIAPSNIALYSVFLGAGNDTFTSAGNSATGIVPFGAINLSTPPTVSVYGGPGNDTLVESAVSTPGETFSGGAGVDTVDYSARTVAVTTTVPSPVGPVFVTIDPTGATKSGAVTMGTGSSGNGTAIGTAVLTAVTSTGAGGPCPLTASGTQCPGNAQLPTVVENDVILDADVILGTAGNDYLAGGAGCTSETLNGGLGNDTFLEGTGPNASDTLVGGGGTDVVDYSARAASLTVAMDAKTASGDPTPTGTAGCVEADIIGTDVANIRMGAAGGTYTGNALNNVFYSFASATGANIVNGSDGDDTLNEDNGIGANDTFSGGKGTDTVDYSHRTNPISMTMDGVTAGGEGIEADIIGTDVENLYGGAAADTLQGNDNDNDIEGNGASSGQDVLCGLNGNDTLLGNPQPGSNVPAALHGSDCADAVNDMGYNLCFNVGGTGGTPTTAGANTADAWCEVVTQ